MMFVRLPVALVVLAYQSFVLALGQIWANKLRGVLTTLGIMIGVAAVSAVITLITGMRDKVVGEFEAFGTNKVFVGPKWPEKHRAKVSWRKIAFKPGEFEGLLGHCPSLGKFTRVINFPGPVAYGSRKEDEAQVIAVDASWHEVENRYVTEGRPLSAMDNEGIRPVCLINKAARDKLQMNRDPSGQFISWGGHRLLVVGLLEPPAGSLGFDPDRVEVVMPFEIGERLQPYGYYLLGTAKSAGVSEEAKAEIEFFVRQKRHIKPGDEDTFHVETAQRELEQFNTVTTVVTLIATGIVGISLLVGGVGIMNIMLVSVSERTREIGLRKAVGARPSAILMQFLVEAVVLCLVGGVMGLLAGQGITSVVVGFIPKEAKMGTIIVPPSAVAVALGFSAGVGLVFGMFPALKASRLDPIEALRHE